MVEPYRMICVDVDGTLVRDDKSIPQENIEALHQASKQGLIVAIASGRSTSSVRELIHTLGLKEVFIALNGAYIKYADQVIKHPMTREQLHEAYAIVSSFHTNATFNTSTYTIRNREIPDSWQVSMQNGSLKDSFRIAQDEEILKKMIRAHQQDILKISLLEEEAEKYQAIRSAFEKTNLFQVVQSDLHYLDITAPFITKGKGVAELASAYQYPLSQVICIGDNENDLEMIQLAGCGVAMGNAHPSLKEVAQLITKNNNQAGVAYVLRQLLGGELK